MTTLDETLANMRSEAAVRRTRERRLVAIGEAVEACKFMPNIGDVRLGDGRCVWNAASLLSWLLAAGDEVAGGPADVVRREVVTPRRDADAIPNLRNSPVQTEFAEQRARSEWHESEVPS